MAISILIEGTLNSESVTLFPKLCSEAFKTTRALDGCHNKNFTFNVENTNNFVLAEVWESKQHCQKYADFRINDGTVDAIENMCSSAQEIKIFDITDA